VFEVDDGIHSSHSYQEDIHGNAYQCNNAEFLVDNIVKDLEEAECLDAQKDVSQVPPIFFNEIHEDVLDSVAQVNGGCDNSATEPHLGELKKCIG